MDSWSQQIKSLMVFRLPGWLIYYIFEWNFELLLFSGYDQIWIRNENMDCFLTTWNWLFPRVQSILLNVQWSILLLKTMNHETHWRKNSTEPVFFPLSLLYIQGVLKKIHSYKICGLQHRLWNRETWIQISPQLSLICYLCNLKDYLISFPLFSYA